MSHLKVYNSLTQNLEDFSPWQPPVVKMYCCGPTVYDYLHVGNFRGAVFYQFLRQVLRAEGYQVRFVYNFTDIDDKIIDRANKEGRPAEEISEFYIQEFWKDFDSLGLERHDHNPKVTETLKEIESFIQRLIDQGYAYVTAQGDVYFSINQFPEYGKLSHRQVEQMRQGVRIDLKEDKKDPLDFALWKAAKPGEPAWPSPWGMGRPGWHIECSAMSYKFLGEQVDIHGGGLDLLFPHHENEIAQSEACHHKPFVKYWVHNNLIQMDGAKMSKSLGNIIKARNFFAQYHPEIFKFMVLSVHYRSVLDLGREAIDRAIYGLSKIYSAWARALAITGVPQAWPEELQALQHTQPSPDLFAKPLEPLWQELWNKMQQAYRQDFNSALLLSYLHEAIRLFNKELPPQKSHTSSQAKSFALGFLQLLWRVHKLTALLQQEPQGFLRFLDDWLLQRKNITREWVDAQVEARAQAREQKRFQDADAIRAQLTALGISLQDQVDGRTLWEVDKSNE